MAVAEIRGTAGDQPPARLRLTHLLMVEAVVSGEGLSRVSEIASEAIGGASIVVLVPAHRIAAGAPGNLPASLLARLERHASSSARSAERPTELTLEEPIVSGGETIGLVAVVSPIAREQLEHARHVLHLIAMVTLIEIALEQSGEEDEQTLRGAFFDDLRSRRELGRAEVVTRAGRLGCELSAGIVVLCAQLNAQRPRHVAGLITGDHPGALVQHVEGRLFAILPAPEGPRGPAEAVEQGRRLGRQLDSDGAAGLSGFYPDPADLGRAIREAELMLELSRREDPPVAAGIDDSPPLAARTLGEHPEAIRTAYERTVAPLVLHDRQYGSHLLSTLEIHLKHACDVDGTAATVRAHRHTVVHRLERVRELTGLDCARPEDRERLSLGLRAHRLLAPDLPR